MRCASSDNAGSIERLWRCHATTHLPPMFDEGGKRANGLHNEIALATVYTVRSSQLFNTCETCTTTCVVLVVVATTDL
jgi:hypothetical protein